MRTVLQEGVGHGVQSSPRHVLGEIKQGLAVNGGGFAECRGHPLKAGPIGPRVCKTIGFKVRKSENKLGSLVFFLTHLDEQSAETEY